MCSLTTECVLFLQNMFSSSNDNMHSRASLRANAHAFVCLCVGGVCECVCALVCVLLLQNVFSYYRMCSLTTKCVLFLQNMFSYYRMCSLPTEYVLF